MAKAERVKGVGGEQEVARIFRAASFDCDRVPNSGGLRIKGDLLGTVPAHVEVKRQEVARPWAWWEQASSEAPAGVMPVVAFRRNRSPWLAIVPLERVAQALAVNARAVELVAAMQADVAYPPGSAPSRAMTALAGACAKLEAGDLP